MAEVRCFVAIELPPEVKTALSFLEERLRAGQYPFIKWVSPDSIHLTLKFLGNVSQEVVTLIGGNLAEAAKVTEPFELQMGKKLGAFPNWRRPQVVWVGIEGERDKLSQLQRSVEENLIPLGFKPESRPFMAHLALGRLKDSSSPRQRQEFGKWACSLAVGLEQSFTVASLSLMQSTLTPQGAIYARLTSISL